jgi:hypothetical protein
VSWEILTNQMTYFILLKNHTFKQFLLSFASILIYLSDETYFSQLLHSRSQSTPANLKLCSKIGQNVGVSWEILTNQMTYFICCCVLVNNGIHDFKWVVPDWKMWVTAIRLHYVNCSGDSWVEGVHRGLNKILKNHTFKQFLLSFASILIYLSDETYFSQLLILAPTRELAIQVSEAVQTYARGMKG